DLLHGDQHRWSARPAPDRPGVPALRLPPRFRARGRRHGDRARAVPVGAALAPRARPPRPRPAPARALPALPRPCWSGRRRRGRRGAHGPADGREPLERRRGRDRRGRGRAVRGAPHEPSPRRRRALARVVLHPDVRRLDRVLGAVPAAVHGHHDLLRHALGPCRRGGALAGHVGGADPVGAVLQPRVHHPPRARVRRALAAARRPSAGRPREVRARDGTHGRGVPRVPADGRGRGCAGPVGRARDARRDRGRAHALSRGPVAHDEARTEGLPGAHDRPVLPLGRARHGALGLPRGVLQRGERGGVLRDPRRGDDRCGRLAARALAADHAAHARRALMAEPGARLTVRARSTARRTAEVIGSWVGDRRARIAVWIGFALVVAGLAGFLAVLDAVRDADDLAALDEPVLTTLAQGRSDLLTGVLTVVTVAAGTPVLPLVVLGAALVWGLVRERWWQGGLLAGAMVVSTLVSVTLKRVVARPRPPVDTMTGAGIEESYSFPSGHT